MRRSSWLIAAAMTFAAAPAAANGRYPASNQLYFTERDPDLVVLRVTFGLLVSHDRGKTFDYVCETSIGFTGQEDPMYTLTPSGAYVGSTFQGITVSRDNACNWGFAGEPIGNKVFIDLAGNPTAGGNIVAFESSYDKQDDAGNILFRSRLFETRDDAQTWSLLGQALDPTLLGYTVDLTKSDPNRIYVSASRDPGAAPRAFLVTSRDHGKSWEDLSVPLVDKERSVFVSAVDPNDAERVYLRTASSLTEAPTRLILRELGPGGVPTLRTLFTGTGPLLGFALSADGSKVYVGGPKDGVQVANTSDFAFEQRAKIEVQCLASHGDEVWACSSEFSGFVAGVSKDDGRTFESRLHFCEIRGSLACAAGTTTGNLCPPLWESMKLNLGCTGSPDAGTGSGGDAGASPTSGSSSSCSCGMTPAAPWGAFAVALGATLAIVRRMRTRRRL